MEIQQQFETMIGSHLPNADLSRDPDHPGFYLDQNVQTAWAGFKALSESFTNTTICTGNNHDHNQSAAS